MGDNSVLWEDRCDEKEAGLFRMLQKVYSNKMKVLL